MSGERAPACRKHPWLSPCGNAIGQFYLAYRLYLRFPPVKRSSLIRSATLHLGV